MSLIVFSLLLGLACCSISISSNYDTRSVINTMHGKEELEELKRLVLGIDSALKKLLTKREESTSSNQALISGEEHNVKDDALSASSNYRSRADFGPQCSRLAVAKPSNCYSTCWVGDENQAELWIQVDLGVTCTIGEVATRGRGEYAPQYVAAYKLASNDGTLLFYTDAFYPTAPKIFGGNSDMTSVVTHSLQPAMKARRVRLYVVTYNAYPSMSWELYGIPCTCRC